VKQMELRILLTSDQLTCLLRVATCLPRNDIMSGSSGLCLPFLRAQWLRDGLQAFCIVEEGEKPFIPFVEQSVRSYPLGLLSDGDNVGVSGCYGNLEL
jgi:hypothetical protein